MNEKITRIYGLVLLLLVFGYFVTLGLWISGYAISYWWLGLIGVSAMAVGVAIRRKRG